MGDTQIIKPHVFFSIKLELIRYEYIKRKVIISIYKDIMCVLYFVTSQL